MNQTKKIFALGFFDGVHLGHQALLRACVRLAAEQNAQPAAITFGRHPQALFSDTVPPLINTTSDREILLRQQGITQVTVLPTTKEVMSTPWGHFLEALERSSLSGVLVQRAISQAQNEYALPREQTRRDSRRLQSHAITFCICGIMSMVTRWHRSGYTESPAELAQIAATLLTRPLVQS